MFVVPTGIGSSIGGHAGDATPAAQLLASVSDTLVTHPNVVNASDMNELPANALYVEGSVLARVLMGTVGLAPVRSNRVLVVADAHPDSFFSDQLLNSLNAARSLRTASAEVTAGTVWDPRPHPRIALSLRPRPQLDIGTLAGRGPGLTPLGDDILVGYLAAAALAGASGAAVTACAARSGRATTALSRTLLRLAARGALPEAAHRLLVDGDPEPLLAFGASSGKGIAFGLALFGVGAAGTESEERVVRLGESGFALVVSGADGVQRRRAALEMGVPRQAAGQASDPVLRLGPLQHRL